MRTRTSVLATAHIVALAGLLLVSGCGPERQSGPAGGAASRPSPSATSPTAVAAAPLSAAQLKSLVFKVGEVPQDRGPLEAREPRPDAEGRTPRPVSVPACRPLVDVRDSEDAHARVHQIFNWKKNIMGGASLLASYEGDRAQRRFAELRKALADCRSYEGEGYAGKFEVTVEEEKPPAVGDEAIAFRETILVGADMGGFRSEQFTVVRTGGALAVFSELSVGSELSFPAELIARQVDRLRNAQRP
ncbi:hypothetical protein ACFVU3_11870 [Streptomyces sp. NPDC058052]|uniref:hypothetical protein n=1 Tax=Streptomyces sp. NPDC058052 TaxID=3346316 RepID=UPI0036E3474C